MATGVTYSYCIFINTDSSNAVHNTNSEKIKTVTIEYLYIFSMFRNMWKKNIKRKIPHNRRCHWFKDFINRFSGSKVNKSNTHRQMKCMIKPCGWLVTAALKPQPTFRPRLNDLRSKTRPIARRKKSILKWLFPTSYRNYKWKTTFLILRELTNEFGEDSDCTTRDALNSYKKITQLLYIYIYTIPLKVD